MHFKKKPLIWQPAKDTIIKIDWNVRRCDLFHQNCWIEINQNGLLYTSRGKKKKKEKKKQAWIAESLGLCNRFHWKSWIFKIFTWNSQT